MRPSMSAVPSPIRSKKDVLIEGYDWLASWIAATDVDRRRQRLQLARLRNCWPRATIRRRRGWPSRYVARNSCARFQAWKPIPLREPEAIIPVVLIQPSPGGRWQIELNPETLPGPLINQTYFADISRLTANNATHKAFLNECFNNANWLIRSLDQRAITILKVAAEVSKTRSWNRRCPPAATQSQSRCRGDQHACVDRKPDDVEQVYAPATWCIRTEVFLHRRDGFLPRRYGALR